MAPKKNKASGAGKKAAQVGLGALVLGAITWLTGGFSRENGIEWVRSILVALAVALAIRWSLAEPFKIPSGSMIPTFEIGDRIFVNKWVYGLRFPLNRFRIPLTNIRIHYADRRIWQRPGPQRWDIVVFKAVEPNAEHDTLVKRVVGLPGERIQIANNKVYVNGEPLELPDSMPSVEYTRSGQFGVLAADEYSVVPDGCYLFLGDNSSRSRDGRMWGWAPNEHILGRVSAIWWPLSRWRDFTGFSSAWWWRTLIAVLSVLLVVRLFFGRSLKVRTGELSDTLTEGDHIFINRCAYGLPIPFVGGRFYRGRQPVRGELVVYDARLDGESHILVGRVAGLPGERVRLDAGRLCVDGQALKEPACLADRTFDATGDYGRSKGKQLSNVPEDHYFILSDASMDDGPDDPPLDSRTVGWTSHKNLVGVVSSVWWPPQRWRKINR